MQPLPMQSRQEVLDIDERGEVFISDTAGSFTQELLDNLSSSQVREYVYFRLPSPLTQPLTQPLTPIPQSSQVPIQPVIGPVLLDV